MLTRRMHLAALGAVAMGGLASAVRAQPQPAIVYADGMGPGWFIGGWAKYTQQFPHPDNQKPVEVTMAAWNALTFQSNTPFDFTPFSTLTVVTNGGDKGKQEVELTAKLGDKVVSEAIIIRCQKNQWGRVDIPLKKMKIKGDRIDTLFLNNKSAEAMPPFYINYVLFQ